MENKDIYKKIKDVVDQHGTLIYLTLVGSRLFGIDLPNSDYDVKGIYLPSLKSIFLGNYKRQIRFKDEKYDLDVTVFSLQTFIKHVQKLDINSLDMLFSKSSKEAVIYSDDILFNKYFTVENIQKHILTNKMSSFIGYSYAQLDKCNIKISRLNEVIKLRKNIEKILSNPKISIASFYINLIDLRLRDIIDDIDFSEFKYIDKSVPKLLTSSDDMMRVLTKLFPYRSKIGYVLNGLNLLESRYGKRAVKNLYSADFKSLSHAYRSVFELYCLLTDGEIVFPLTATASNYMLDIRKGKIELDYVIKSILDVIDEVKKIKSNFNDNIDVNFLENIILDYCWGGL